MVRTSLVAVVLLFCLGGIHAGDKKDNKKDDAKEIVGRWENPVIKSAYFRFNADGTCRDVRLLETREGKYRLLPGFIEFDFPGVFGRYKEETRYRLEGNTLKLWMFGSWVDYGRAK
ncbi:MAG TPA: hypothetical protein VFE62_19945 [Gemmataceae bacterium]|nr:hypothetical protein [Gemmataceae bacterium]